MVVATRIDGGTPLTGFGRPSTVSLRPSRPATPEVATPRGVTSLRFSLLPKAEKAIR